MTLSVRLRGHTCMHPDTRVTLGGLDITTYVRGLTINAYVGSLTEVSLDLIGVSLDTDLREMAVPMQYVLPFPERGNDNGDR